MPLAWCAGVLRPIRPADLLRALDRGVARPVSPAGTAEPLYLLRRPGEPWDAIEAQAAPVIAAWHAGLTLVAEWERRGRRAQHGWAGAPPGHVHPRGHARPPKRVAHGWGRAPVGAYTGPGATPSRGWVGPGQIVPTVEAVPPEEKNG